MRFSPRKSEWEAVAEALDTGVLDGTEYDSPESLARAIVSRTAKALLEREWWLNIVALHEPGGKPYQVGYGLFASEAEARKSEYGGTFRRMTISVSPDTTTKT